jgi:hypothetical protein
MYPGISDNKIEIVTKVLKKLCWKIGRETNL